MVKLFYSSMCDSSRSVLLLAKAIDLPLELQSVNLMGRELFTEDFLKIPVGHQSKGINVVELAKLDDAFNILEKYLDGQKWLAGDEISVADYNYVTIISSAEAIGYDLSKYENVSCWLTRAKGSMEDYDELNQTGVDEFSGWFHNKLNEIESQDK